MNQTSQPAFKRMTWLVGILLLVFIVLLVSAFVRAGALHQALEQKRDVLEPMVMTQQAEQATLQVQLTYVQSDEYVSQWAQENAGMTEPGMTLVRPVRPTLTPVPPPTPVPTPTITPTPQPFWERWWQALTGR